MEGSRKSKAVPTERQAPEVMGIASLHPSYAVRSGLLYALHDQRRALPHAYAHGAQAFLATALLELMHGGQDQASAAGAQWMAEGDGAAVRVDPRVVIGDAQITGYRQALSSEGLVQFDHV